VVAKVEFHFGELFPRVGFIVTNLAVRGNGGDARCKGEKANGERNRSHVPRLSSAMSLGSAIPWRVALQQSPPPLYRPESMLNPPAETVNHHLLGAGDFQPALTKQTDLPTA
jgi:hypothetical protein